MFAFFSYIMIQEEILTNKLNWFINKILINILTLCLSDSSSKKISNNLTGLSNKLVKSFSD